MASIRVVRIVLAYITVTGGHRTDIYSARFASSYLAFPPEVEHETLVVCNGGPPSRQIEVILAGLPNLKFYPRNNSGWDIGAYIDVAQGPGKDADMLLCLGESVYFHRPGWLKPLVQAWTTWGEGMYGVYASNAVRSHMNTTAFATSPGLLSRYPLVVTTNKARYDFEHGPWAFWRILAMNHKPTILVTWDGFWEPHEWRRPQNILWRGDQTNCLMWCNHVENYREATTRVKNNWQRWCDQPFA